MRLASINKTLHIVTDEGSRPVRMELGSDPIRRVLSTRISLSSLIEHADSPEPLDSAQTVFDPPICEPSKIVCIGLNYLDHCREAGVDVPDSIVSFTKHPSSLIGSGEPIVLDPMLSTEVDYEVEVAVVFGRRCRDVQPEDAFDVVGGFTIANDVSARDIQAREGQWVRAKSFDTFCPLGPYLLTPDEVSDPQSLSLRTELSGKVVQDSSTAEMINPIRELIAHVTKGTTFEIGDILLTGTPWGTGAFLKPPIFLQPGDDVRCSVSGLGELFNPVAAR
jgi:2-keto-4-pentenoate hydratase/2-oxohepta-3-ene-1,7-dioic acid hydratase in catechol pathway